MEHYDFRKNWKGFYAIWQSAEIQDILAKNVCSFLQETDRPDAIWTKGDSLWQFSDSDHFQELASVRAREYVEENRCITSYEKSMERAGIHFRNRKLLERAFRKTCFGAICDSFLPQSGSLESLVCLKYKNFFTETMYEVAIRLFPESGIICIKDAMDDDLIIIESKFIFSIEDYYWASLGHPHYDADSFLYHRAPILLAIDFDWRGLGLYHVIRRCSADIPPTCPELLVWESLRVFALMAPLPFAISLPIGLIHHDPETALILMREIFQLRRDSGPPLVLKGLLDHNLIIHSSNFPGDTSVWVMEHLHSFVRT